MFRQLSIKVLILGNDLPNAQIDTIIFLWFNLFSDQITFTLVEHYNIIIVIIKSNDISNTY